MAKYYFLSKVDFLKEVESIALQASVEDLYEVFSRYFTKQNRFSKFKKCCSFKSYTTKNLNHNIRLIIKHWMTLPKLGLVRLKNLFVDALTNKFNVSQLAKKQLVRIIFLF